MKPTTQRRNPATPAKLWRRRVGSVTIPFWVRHLTLLSLVWFFLTELSTGEEKWNVPRVGHKLTFPRDHGSHPDFKIEWWYLTGHLFSDTERFGFQATFFRLGQRPEDVPKGELFGDEQIYMAHMGISHPDTNTFLHEERLNRGGWDAGASLEGLNVKNGNWKLVEKGGGMELVGSVRSEASYKLCLRPHKQHVIFGEEGISRKGPEGTASSYYITFPRLNAEGEISFQGETYSVAGEAWMDHEISSSQLDRNQIGWDWACLQFYDGREIMGYVLRTDSGEPSEYSKFVWIDPTGKLTHQKLGDYRWIHDGAWKSPKTGAEYPISPRIETVDPNLGELRTFQLKPTMDGQEMANGSGGVSYWEGACDIWEGDEIVGRAFLEMTGYADSIADKLR